MRGMFDAYLEEKHLAGNTKIAYLTAVRQFEKKFGSFSKENLENYRNWMKETYSPRTVNLRVCGMNCYLEWLRKPQWKLKAVRVQQNAFLENVISDKDYRFIRNRLKQDGKMMWYFIVRYMAATGMRVSELLQMKAEDVKAGHVDLYAKGGKMRRIYIPNELQKETLSWTRSLSRESGFLFISKKGTRMTPGGLYCQLKKLGKRYGISPLVMHPHSFRHRFAKNFLERCNDLSFLADLMGHENTETTRIYLRKTSNEQADLVSRVVDW